MNLERGYFFGFAIFAFSMQICVSLDMVMFEEVSFSSLFQHLPTPYHYEQTENRDFASIFLK